VSHVCKKELRLLTEIKITRVTAGDHGVRISSWAHSILGLIHILKSIIKKSKFSALKAGLRLNYMQKCSPYLTENTLIAL
jgi:hypothetical protein